MFVLLSKEGKELTSFEEVANHDADEYAEFVDVTRIVNTFMATFEKLEQTQNASKTAQAFSLSPEQYRYGRVIEQSTNLDESITCNFDIWFVSDVTEEKTHEETVSDGWFTYNRTVSDGYRWTTTLPSSVSGYIYLEYSSVTPNALYQGICQHLANGRKKMGDGAYVKNVNLDGKTFECRTTVEMGSDRVSFELTFNR